MQSHILRFIWKSHPLWQVHAPSHLTRHIKGVGIYTSYQNPTPSGKYMHSLILHVISKSHPLWQVHAQSHLTRHIKIPPPLASTCTVTSYITRSKSHPLWQAHTKSHLTLHDQNPTHSGKHIQSHILRFVSKSHPLWQVHAQSHLTRQIKIPPPLASTCTVSSYTSYQNPTPSGKYMQGHILHVISKSHPLWQVHAQSHLTRHIKIPPLWQVHAKSHLTRHIKIPPPLESTCTVSSYTFTDLGLQSIVYEPCFTSHGLRIMVYEPWFTSHGLRSMVYEPWFTSHGLRSIVYEPWFTSHGLRSIVYEQWFTEAEVNQLGQAQQNVALFQCPIGIHRVYHISSGILSQQRPLFFLVLQIPMAILLGGDP